MKELADSVKDLSQIIQKMQLQNSIFDGKLDIIDKKITHVEYILRGYPPPDVVDYPRPRAN